jgi:hypothetical protein
MMTNALYCWRSTMLLMHPLLVSLAPIQYSYHAHFCAWLCKGAAVQHAAAAVDGCSVQPMEPAVDGCIVRPMEPAVVLTSTL